MFVHPECAAFDYFWLGNGRKTPEIQIALIFYTASAKSGRSECGLLITRETLRSCGPPVHAPRPLLRVQRETRRARPLNPSANQVGPERASGSRAPCARR